MSNRPSDRPSDRPDHPPVWVRGGPPYYYMPTRPTIPTSPGETLRRASTTSSLSSSGGTLSPPPSPATTATQLSGLPSPPPFPLSSFGGSQMSQQLQAQAQSSRSPYMAQPPGSEAQSTPRPDAFRRSNSISGTNLFSNLASQKRNTADTSFAMRREQWHEQNVGVGPEKKRFFSSWWDK
ncbi:hypothetical protein EMCG_04394 [[Emmonsia] crescens]|uniref:Uncharacterized protein n=1 Tax=[Emmonsia] crescens TaxID=73230 RepID=A0A0G2J7I3_9EURO|nr:hypothetical protein EMCG_04394 [Emmonsia crescens UAMH 3008]